MDTDFKLKAVLPLTRQVIDKAAQHPKNIKLRKERAEAGVLPHMTTAQIINLVLSAYDPSKLPAPQLTLSKATHELQHYVHLPTEYVQFAATYTAQSYLAGVGADPRRKPVKRAVGKVHADPYPPLQNVDWTNVFSIRAILSTEPPEPPEPPEEGDA